MLFEVPSLAAVPLAPAPTPVEELNGLRRTLGRAPRLLVKRDDAIAFAFGGNKVRKLRYVAAAALAERSDTLITSGGIQSNHARVTAAVAARLGLRCILVVNGSPPDRPTGNALLHQLLGAEIRYVSDRTGRLPAMHAAAEEVRSAGGRPYLIPLGASTPLGAVAFVDAIRELQAQIDAPDVIVHSTSSGGTQAGIITGCHLAGWTTRVIGISADESAPALEKDIRAIIDGMPSLLGVAPNAFSGVDVMIDDRFVGGGYGIPTPESQAAIELLARSEGLFLDPTYTAKAMAGLIARCKTGEFTTDLTVLFWHTGGQVGLFA